MVWPAVTGNKHNILSYTVPYTCCKKWGKGGNWVESNRREGGEETSYHTETMETPDGDTQVHSWQKSLNWNQLGGGGVGGSLISTLNTNIERGNTREKLKEGNRWTFF